MANKKEFENGKPVDRDRESDGETETTGEEQG